MRWWRGCTSTTPRCTTQIFQADDGTNGTELWKYVGVDTTPPSFVSAATNADGSKVILTYNEALFATTAAAGAFAVLVGGSTANAVTAVTVNGTKVELTLTIPVTDTQTLTVAYTAPASNAANTNSAVQDTTGNDAVTLAAQNVTNLVTPSIVNVTSSTADDTYKAEDTISIQVTFSQAVTVTGYPQLLLETG